MSGTQCLQFYNIENLGIKSVNIRILDFDVPLKIM